MPKIYPVIHHIDASLTKKEANLAFFCGADGVFLISHEGLDAKLIPLAKKIAKKHPNKKVGVNLLRTTFSVAYVLALNAGIKMLWVDNPYITSSEAGALAIAVSRDIIGCPNAPEIFASVAFKYQPEEPDPPAAAATATRLGFIPTTSGAATGAPPDVEKIIAMSKAAGPRLAIASGMTPQNVSGFLPMTTDILVSTGISNQNGRFDRQKLLALIDAAHSAA